MHNADEFLVFIAQNEKDLKQRLRKNITYQKELFDESFQDSILKVYTHIVKHNKRIDDFLQYSFIAFKFNYINAQNAYRRRQSTYEDISEYKNNESFSYTTEFEEEVDEYEMMYEVLKHELTYMFGEEDVSVFFDYMRAGRGGYARIAEERNMPAKKVKECVCKIKAFLNENYGDKYFIKLKKNTKIYDKYY